MSQFETTFPQLPDGFVNAVNDSFPGGGNSSPGLAPGQLGKVFWFQASGPFDSTVGTVREGHLRYVQTLLGSTAAPAVGAPAYWSNKPNHVVTPDAPANPANIAGVYLNAATKGNYTLIQISGRVVMKFLASTTKTTPVAGDSVVSGGTGGLADVLADATAVTWATANQLIGTLTGSITSQLGEVDLLSINV